MLSRTKSHEQVSNRGKSNDSASVGVVSPLSFRGMLQLGEEGDEGNEHTDECQTLDGSVGLRESFHHFES